MRILQILIWVLLLGLSALAQTPIPTASPSPEVTSSPSPTVSPSASPSPLASPSAAIEVEPQFDVPDEFSTPRKSLENFMATMALAGPLRPDLYLQAKRHLDLSAISRVVRDETGVTLSQQLYAILDTAELKLNNLDVEPGETRVFLYRQPSGDEIVMLRGEDGQWLFSEKTVEAIPRMYEVLTQKGEIKRWYIDALNFGFLGLNGNLWLALMLLPILGFGLGSLVVMLLRLSFGPLLKKKADLDVEGQKKVLKPAGWVTACIVVWTGLSILELPTALLLVLAVVVKVIATLALVTAFFRASDAASVYIGRFTASTSTKFDDMLIPLVRRTLKTLVAIIGILFLAQNLDIEVWSLFAGFSIFGAMVALAGQDTVKNFFGSLTVLLDQPFAVGDWIVVNGIEGVVEEVGFRSTRIRTFYDSLITLPNSQLITASVDNYGARNFRRYSKKIPVSWKTAPETLEAFCEGIRELVRQHPYTRKDSYQVWVNDMNDYSLQIMIYIFWAAPDWNTELREKHRFLIDLHRLATDLGVELAYPSQRILVTRKEDNFEENFDLERQESARLEGKEKTQGLLKSSLPDETPPPAVIE